MFNSNKNMSESTSIITNRNRDCASCKVISGTGLIGAGLYIAYHSKNLQKAVGKSVMLALAGTSLGLGLARMFDLPPFRDQFHRG